MDLLIYNEWELLILGSMEGLCMCMNSVSVFVLCSDFVTEDYTETHYSSDGTPVVTKPDQMVGWFSRLTSFCIME